jgi:hypothetical protein
MGNVTSFFRSSSKPMSMEETKRQIQYLEITISVQRRTIESRQQTAIDNALVCKTKSRAVHYIRLKKMYDEEIRKLDALSLQLESYRLTLEVTKINADVVRITANTTNVLRREMDAIDVHRVKEEFDEVMDDIKNIESVMYSETSTVDDFDLEQELAMLVTQPKKPLKAKEREMEMLME